ncbi:augmin complex subunit dgt5-like [Episyrphus balteatus]|uniref:augmin complex subunit dgt5-like n=1 Tax=Episyrphus balteatus TaxID=286459 RepID=UPI002485060D|nr:augmin complex subunit dgt5-like [Episyrphus balteatus]
MTLDEDILAFEIWATKLGFPQNDMPSRDAIRSIFKSPRQRDVFCNMIERVKPRQEVQVIRENILIRKMDKLKDQVVPACSRSFLPKEMQRYLKVKDLKQRKSDLEAKTTEVMSQYNSLSNSIKTKNMQSIKLKQKLECLQAKVDMLDLKRDKLKQDLEKEKSNKKRIIATMPVKLTSANANENVAANAVEEAYKELDSFYTLVLNNSNPHIVQEAKDDMWRKMRKLFTNIPNFLIFNSILKVKEEQLQNIMTLNKTPKIPFKENLSAFDLKLLKAKASILGMAANYMSARQESHSLNQRFSLAYTQFVEAVQCKVNLFNIETDDDIDDIISNYIVQYNTRVFNKGQNDYILAQIELCKAQIECGTKQLEDHEILLNSIKQVYTDIDSSINRIQYEVMQLHQMKEKILFSKNMLQHLLGDMQLEQSHYLPSVMMKMSGNFTTTASGDGNVTFDMSNGNVFSSTKLDFDSTLNSSCALARSGDVTILPGATHSRYILPPILTEICTFMETPFEKFSCVTKECAFYLMPNPLITESHELSSTIQLAPGILLTPHGCLQEVNCRVAWSDSISDISSELKINSITISTGVNPANMRAKSKQQREQLVELLDKIEVADINTNRLLKKATKYYSFLLRNPLKNYIPPTKCLNNQTYSDYESEYQTYYRMVTMGNFIK